MHATQTRYVPASETRRQLPRLLSTAPKPFDSRWRRLAAAELLCVLGGLAAPLGCSVDDRMPVVARGGADDSASPLARSGSDAPAGAADAGGALGGGEAPGARAPTSGPGGDSGGTDLARGMSAVDGESTGSSGDAGAPESAETDTTETDTTEPVCPPCPPGASCSGGVCQCPDGVRTACDDGCFDLNTDRRHCGSCSTTCDDSCAAGLCFTLIAQGSTSATPSEPRFAVNGTAVYYTQPEAGTVSRASFDGAVLEVLATGQALSVGIALDANAVYWTTNEGITRMPLAGGPRTELLTSPSENYRRPGHVAIGATDAYFTSDGSVAKVPTSGGAETVMAAGVNANAIALDATHVYWSSLGGGSGSGANVAKVPRGGGPITALATGFERVRDLALHDDQVYFVINNAFVQSLARVSTSGGPVTTLASVNATCIAVDSTGIYLGGAGTFQNSVLYFGLDGAGPTTFAGGAFSSQSIELDEDRVFWSSALDGIRSAAKLP